VAELPREDREVAHEGATDAEEMDVHGQRVPGFDTVLGVAAGGVCEARPAILAQSAASRPRHEDALPMAPTAPKKTAAAGKKQPVVAKKQPAATKKQSAGTKKQPAVRKAATVQRPRNALYAQSGGVTAVINASAAGVIETARKHGARIGTVYAARNGILGALHEELIDTSKESAATIAALRHTPAGAFGSCRYKLKSFEENQREYERLIEVFRAHDIGYFFYNGGGDSQDTANKVSQIGARLGYPVTCIGVPKTVDNDLPVTDTCPGFGSVAKYVAVSVREAGLDVKSMCESSTKVFIMEVMGRHAGWIAAAGGLAQEEKDDPPHIILFPEVPFEREKFLAAVDATVKRIGYCVIVVSEGAQYPDGTFLAEAGTRDAFGHAQLGGVAPAIAQMVKEGLGLKYHWAVADYLQRAARHIASKVDVEQAYAMGRAAVEYALKGRNGVMPIIVRTSDSPYRWKVDAIELDRIANQEKKMPADYITADGYGITAKARTYLAPLIAGEDYPPYRNGLPRYARLKGVLAKKKLPAF
jgi:6-phosphofructokinase 1